jgi:hypothetical protein
MCTKGTLTTCSSKILHSFQNYRCWSSYYRQDQHG